MEMLGYDYSRLFTHTLAVCLGSILSYTSIHFEDVPFFSENSVLYLFSPKRLEANPNLISKGHSYYLTATKKGQSCLISKKLIRYVHDRPLIMIEIHPSLLNPLNSDKTSHFTFREHADYPLCHWDTKNAF